MGRPTPLTIPVVTLIPTFSGLPIATTGSPTPTLSASSRTPLANLTETSSAPSTTCWLVTMWPCSSSTNPDPPLGPNSEEATSTLTTPGPLCVYTSRTGGPAPSPDSPSAGGETSLIVPSPDPSSKPDIPKKMKSAVTSPPITADTNAVSAVLRTCSFRSYPPLYSPSQTLMPSSLTRLSSTRRPR